MLQVSGNMKLEIDMLGVLELPGVPWILYSFSDQNSEHEQRFFY